MSSRQTTLLIMPPDRRSRLVAYLEPMQAELLIADSCGEARKLLQAQPGIRVVLTDQSLPDGTWADVLRLVAHQTDGARVIVCSRVGDERLWVQAVDAGAFDVLPEPYHRGEVERILHSAVSPPVTTKAVARAS